MPSDEYYYCHLHLCFHILKLKLKGISKTDVAIFIIKQEQLLSSF